MSRKPEPHEIEHTCAKVYGAAGRARPRPESTWPVYNPVKAAQYAAAVPHHLDPVQILAEASSECVENATPELFLRTLHPTPGAHVAIATAYRAADGSIATSKAGTWESGVTDPADVNSLATGQLGVYHNINEVCAGGGWKLTDVVSYRYALLESDQDDQDEWLRILLLARLAIVAIYRSGGRSTHALYLMGAQTAEEWEPRTTAVMLEIAQFGADPAVRKPSQLSRLPGCMREEKGRLQELLYLNADPDGGAIWTP
jgi:hypothetical protein